MAFGEGFTWLGVLNAGMNTERVSQFVPIVSAITPKPNKMLVDRAFAAYDRTTVVPQSVALGKK